MSKSRKFQSGGTASSLSLAPEIEDAEGPIRVEDAPFEMPDITPYELSEEDKEEAIQESTRQEDIPTVSKDSPLKQLFNAVGYNDGFDKVVNFLGVLSEVESFKGRKIWNDSSSASGDFHFLTKNGGGYNKNGEEDIYGQYDASGKSKASSFGTAKNRIRNLIKSNPRVSMNPAIIKSFNKILQAQTPDSLSAADQALIAFTDLKMRKGTSLTQFLKGKMTASDLYHKEWVTGSGPHTSSGSKTNWKNAIERSTKEGRNDHYSYLDIEKIIENPFKGKRVFKSRRGGTLFSPESYVNSVRIKSVVI